MTLIRAVGVAGLVLAAGALPVTAYALTSAEDPTPPPAVTQPADDADDTGSDTTQTDNPETDSTDSTDSTDTEAPEAPEAPEAEDTGEPNPASAPGRAHAAADAGQEQHADIVFQCLHALGDRGRCNAEATGGFGQ